MGGERREGGREEGREGGREGGRDVPTTGQSIHRAIKAPPIEDIHTQGCSKPCRNQRTEVTIT
jgi:orotate phosphoribosyltransferase